MTTLTVTPLNNGIVLDVGELVNGMIPLNSGAFLYYTSLGNIYFQSNATTTVALLLAAGFNILCADLIFDGTTHTLWMGGSAGDVVFGTVTLDITDPQAPTQTNDLATQTIGTDNYTAVTFDMLAWGFKVGTSTGLLYSGDVTTGALTLSKTLTAPALPGGATLVISKIVHDYTIDTYLICGTASTNTNVSSPTEYSVIYTGKMADLTFTETEVVGHNLWLGAIGILDNPNAKITDVPPKPKVPKFVVAGGDSVIYISDDGITWGVTQLVDQVLTVKSLSFNTWVFVIGLPYGIILTSMNGVVWTSSYNAALIADVAEVRAIQI